MNSPPVCVRDFAEQAKNLLPEGTKGFFYGGACEQTTLQNNEDAYRRLRIRPRVLVDASLRDTKTTVLGKGVPIPLGVSPSSLQRLAHPDGEIANARAAGSVGGIYILSTMSTTSMEDVRKYAPNTTLWFQLYIYRNRPWEKDSREVARMFSREVTRSLVERAEKAGYEALVLTVDCNIIGVRYADERNKFNLPPNIELGNFTAETQQSGSLRLRADSDGSALRNYADSLMDDRISWEDVTWLKSITKLPIVLKGILTKEDAEIALKYGVQAIMVSNHGGRQIDTVPASIEALPEIVEAVDGRIDVYIDGGVRLGTDIFKALALGAKMVFVGRPVLWGLMHSGEEGAKKVLQILMKEFKSVMGLAGCQKIADIQKPMVVHESYYAKV